MDRSGLRRLQGRRRGEKEGGGREKERRGMAVGGEMDGEGGREGK